MPPRRRAPRLPWLPVAALALLGATAGTGRADDAPAAQPPATQAIADASGKFRFRLPADWTCDPAQATKAVLVVDCHVPGQAQVTRFALFDMLAVELNPLGQAFAERDAHMKEEGSDSAEVRTKPFVHLVWQQHHGDARTTTVIAFARQHGHGIHLRMEAPAETFDALYGAFLAAVPSVEAAVDPWPAVPSGYAQRAVGRHRLYSAPGIDPKELDPIVRLVGAAETSFEAYHGKIVRPADETVSIVVHRTAAASKALSEDAAKSPHGALAVTGGRRVYLTLEATAEARGAARDALAGLFLAERYPFTPEWMWVAEPSLADAEESTGSKGPVITEGWKASFKGLTRAFDDIAPIRDSDWPAYFEHALAYTLLLHYGPAKYKHAYAKFRSALETAGDPAKAEAELRSALDMEKMRKDAGDFLREKVKVAKGG